MKSDTPLTSQYFLYCIYLSLYTAQKKDARM